MDWRRALAGGCWGMGLMAALWLACGGWFGHGSAADIERVNGVRDLVLHQVFAIERERQRKAERDRVERASESKSESVKERVGR